jgi:hypothetical protein
MQHKMMSINEIKPNPDNPRQIKSAAMDLLIKSLKSAPWMLYLRPLVINAEKVILGGNMRYEACKKLGIAEVPVIDAGHLSAENQAEFLIKDNLSYGDWDFDTLINQWDCELLQDWGLEIPDLLTERDEETLSASTLSPDYDSDIALGDIIELGEHRLVCGNYNKVSHLKALFEKSDMHHFNISPSYEDFINAQTNNTTLYGMQDNPQICQEIVEVFKTKFPDASVKVTTKKQNM